MAGSTEKEDLTKEEIFNEEKMIQRFGILLTDIETLEMKRKFKDSFNPGDFADYRRAIIDFYSLTSLALPHILEGKYKDLKYTYSDKSDSVSIIIFNRTIPFNLSVNILNRNNPRIRDLFPLDRRK